MNTNLLKTFFVALFLITATGASAHDFYVDGIYYYITDATAKTVEVTYKGEFSSEFYNEYTGSVVIPSMVTYNNVAYSVTSIGSCAFEDCIGLTSITIPNSVTSIGGGAFEDCIGLTSIVIPDGVTEIKGSAFWQCTGLTCVEIPNSVTIIGGRTFYKCSGLTSVTIGNSVTNIGYNAFYECDGLKEVHISDLAAWCKIDFANDDSNPLDYAHNLYLNGEKVTNLVIPDGVTEIKKYAFYECDGLTGITIPNSVTSIGEEAFCNCSGLKEIYSLSETPATISSDTFSDYSAMLYVPLGAKEIYQAAYFWKKFTNIVEMDYTDIDEIEADDSFNGLRDTYYDLKGSVVENPTKGIYIYNGKKVLVQ